MLENLQRAAAQVLVDRGTTSLEIVRFTALMQKAIEVGHAPIPCPYCFLDGANGHLVARTSIIEPVESFVCTDCGESIEYRET